MNTETERHPAPEDIWRKEIPALEGYTLRHLVDMHYAARLVRTEDNYRGDSRAFDGGDQIVRFVEEKLAKITDYTAVMQAFEALQQSEAPADRILASNQLQTAQILLLRQGEPFDADAEIAHWIQLLENEESEEVVRNHCTNFEDLYKTTSNMIQAGAQHLAPFQDRLTQLAQAFGLEGYGG